jgi:nicotinamide mononucleotide transporter
MTTIEIIAAMLTLFGVFLSGRQLRANWLFGIAGAAIYTFIFYQSVLFAEAALQAWYVVLGVIGWKNWSPNSEEFEINRINWRVALIGAMVTVLFSVISGRLLDVFSPSDVPYLDASLAISGLVCTWFLTKKILENWLIWIVIDLLSACLYIYKNLYATAGLYFILAVLAAYGYQQWKKQKAAAFELR